jgi:hypothetical protein
MESIWDTYNWQRVKAVLPSQADRENAAIIVPQSRHLTADGLVHLLQRRSARGFTKVNLPRGLWADLLLLLEDRLRAFPWLSVRICVQGAEDVATGLYDWNQSQLTRLHEGPLDVGPIVQKQWWVAGAGLSIFLCVDWEGAVKALPGPQGYHGVWLILGQMGQHLVQWACESGLGSRMTPAINESLAREVLMISEKTKDAAYYLRIGVAL